MQLSAKNALLIIGLFLTAASIISPMVWDYYTHRCELEFRIDSMNSLLPEDPLLKDFLITYQGRPIRNLTRMDFTFINSGNTPITSEDIISEPTIQIPRESGVIAAILLNTEPRNLYADLLLDLDFNEVKIKFSLLNPGDFIRLAIYLNGSSKDLPIIAARVKGVREINVVNNIKDNIKIDNKDNWVMNNIMNLFKYLGITTLIAFILVSGKQALDFRRTRSSVKRNPSVLTELDSIDAIKSFIDKNLAALGSDQKKKMFMKELETAEKDFSAENKAKLIAAITNGLNITSGAEIVFGLFVLVLIGLIYFYWPIF